MSALQTTGLWVGVVLIGGAGSVLRFLLDGAITRRTSGRLPYGTLVINVSGSFVLGVLDGVVLPAHAALLAGTAFVGAYTTFSTWMFETQRLAEERQATRALTNLWVSVAAGVAAAGLGLWIGGAW